MGTNEYSQPASKSSWDGQDFGDVKMVIKMAHFHKSSRPQWVNSFDFRAGKMHERFSASAVFQRKIERINTVARHVLL